MSSDNWTNVYRRSELHLHVQICHFCSAVLSFSAYWTPQEEKPSEFLQSSEKEKEKTPSKKDKAPSDATTSRPTGPPIMKARPIIMLIPPVNDSASLLLKLNMLLLKASPLSSEMCESLKKNKFGEVAPWCLFPSVFRANHNIHMSPFTLVEIISWHHVC